MAKRRIWAVICGAVRIEFEVYSIISLLVEWRRQGIIEGIVLSTWTNEVNNISGLREKLKFLDITLAESEPMDEREKMHFSMGFTRQETQMNAALRYLPDDVYVLKCRTDLSMTSVKSMESYLDKDLTPRRLGGFDAGLSQQMVVEIEGISWTFGLGDTVFFGHKRDVMRKISMESFTKLTGQGFAPDCLTYMTAFLHRFSYLEEFYHCVDYWRWARLLQGFARDPSPALNRENFYLPGVFNKFYALYFCILYQCFTLQEDDREWEPVEDIYDVFKTKPGTGVIDGWQVYLKDARIVRDIVENRLEPTEGYRRLYQEIRKLSSDCGYAHCLTITEEDYRETCIWGEKYFGLKPAQWLKWKKPAAVKQSRLGFEQAVSILYFDYLPDQNIANLLRNIIIENPNQNYYHLVMSCISQLKENKRLYHLALFTAAKGQDDAAMKILAKSLMEGEIAPERQREASTIFERIKTMRIFWTHPMRSTRLLAVYYYARFDEGRGGSFSEVFYNMVRQNWRGTKERQLPFLEESLAMAAEYVNVYYKEPEELIGIRETVRFLWEINGGKGLSEEFWSWVEIHEKDLYREMKEKSNEDYSENAGSALRA